MKTADYASGIKGFRLLQNGEPGYQYQTAAGFALESAVRLFTDLPDSCEICFFDPEAKKEEGYIFVRRVGGTYKVMRARRGFSEWKTEEIDRIVALFQSSPLVLKPLDSFESFRVSLIPDHQRSDHIGSRSRPWWRIWS
jgi:hypothetical protein